MDEKPLLMVNLSVADSQYPHAYQAKPWAIVPVYQPDHNLQDLVIELLRAKCLKLIVVNDGSSEEFRSIFDAIGRNEQVVLLEHPVNLGKGSALKTGFNYILSAGMTTCGAVVFDCDGQHSVTDILRVAESLARNPYALSIGARSFDCRMPMRSLLGNTFSRWIVSWLFGKDLADTQSGLRGIPAGLLTPLSKLKGSRYEYEMEMLIFSVVNQIEIKEVPIQTIYWQGTCRSHFNPLLDSLSIVDLLWRRFCQNRFCHKIRRVKNQSVSYRS